MSDQDHKQLPAELAAHLTRHPETQVLELLAPDMLGILRGKRVGRSEFAKPFKDGVNFCGATVLLDAKGATFENIVNGGRDGDPDVIASVVPGSLAPVPWAQVPTAQVLLEMRTAEGEPYFADSRQVLRRTAKALKDVGLTAVVATELEFYVLDGDGDQPSPRVGRIPGTKRLQDGPQYGAMEDVEDVDPFLAELYAVCAAQNIPAGATLKEFSPGQFEVNLHHVPNVELACDHAVLLKRAVKAVARRSRLPTPPVAACTCTSASSTRWGATSSRARARTDRSRMRCDTRSAVSLQRCRNRWRSLRRPQTRIAAIDRVSSCR
jgi:glutamine synthetase